MFNIIFWIQLDCTQQKDERLLITFQWNWYVWKLVWKEIVRNQKKISPVSGPRKLLNLHSKCTYSVSDFYFQLFAQFQKIYIKDNYYKGNPDLLLPRTTFCVIHVYVLTCLQDSWSGIAIKGFEPPTFWSLFWSEAIEGL